MGKIKTFWAALIFVACATSPRENFEQIKVGMYKGDVLDAIGSPVTSEFKNDEYVWTYRFYEGESKILKEVRLKNDSVVYVGEPVGLNPFAKIKIGMSKASVLDILGFPSKVEKQNGAEVWIYKNGSQQMQLLMRSEKLSEIISR